MKLLLDACVWGGTADQLATSWEDVVWAGDWTEDPGDEEILARAHHEGRVFVTLDKDFGELIIVRIYCNAPYIYHILFFPKQLLRHPPHRFPLFPDEFREIAQAEVSEVEPEVGSRLEAFELFAGEGF